MAGLTLRQAEPGDHAALEELFRATVMDGKVRIGVERDPDYFVGARVQADEPDVWAAFGGDGDAVGLFAAGRRRVWLGGERPMRYLYDLRIHPARQQSALLARGFQWLRREVFAAGEWAQTLVLDSNLHALKTLTSGRCGLPQYCPAGRYLSWLLPAQALRVQRGIVVRRAGSGDLVAMQGLLEAAARRRSFAHVLRLFDLGGHGWPDLQVGDFLLAVRAGDVVGMMGLWNQSRFQRLRVCGYSRSTALVRPLWNVWAAAAGKIKLPPPGVVLPLRKATALACADDDPRILRALLGAALKEVDGKLLMVGLSAADPLVPAMRGLRGRVACGHHFLVGWDGAPPRWREPFAFDVARI